MRFHETEIAGVYDIEIEPKMDSRGTFGRCFCVKEFEAAGLETKFVQQSCAITSRKGTVRGLHFQQHPFWETKLVRCVRGAAFVVVVDLRPSSSTHRQWIGFELSEKNMRLLYVGSGCAQGYQTLVDDTELHYQMNVEYQPSAASGVYYADTNFNIDWPLAAVELSEKDRQWPPYLVSDSKLG
ncbi:MAG: dTDP-4-dehydrorhamnose 3,5-epimerase family protein [Planctomycetales bacterium]|nr:dTDP-4-dehydrorhamnose 3,5-epimerase family protein [Planctomycetales bacterium]